VASFALIASWAFALGAREVTWHAFSFSLKIAFLAASLASLISKLNGQHNHKKSLCYLHYLG